MCGIFGYTLFDDRTISGVFLRTLLNGLSRLEYRGYDSAGLYVMTETKDVLLKSVGNVDSLARKVESTAGILDMMCTEMIGIAHTRWATHGSPSELNTHPHVSNPAQEFVVVHNGIITNHVQLKHFLHHHGYLMCTDTDTEVIPVLCRYFHDTIPGASFSTLVKCVLDRLEGSLAILVVSKHFPSEMIATKRGSPLILGIMEGKKSFVIASDRNAILEHTKKMVSLEKDDILHIAKGQYTIFNADNIVVREMENVDTELSQITKGHYAHFMEKEIYEQETSIQQSMMGRMTADHEIKLGGILEYLPEIMCSARLVLIACGSSYHACLATRYLYERLTNMRVSVENSCDFVDRDVHVFANDACIFVSQSGETADVIAALDIARQRRALCIGITNVVGSTIDRDTTCGLHVNAGSEIGVASTKAYTSQIVSLIMLALILSNDYISKRVERKDIMNHLTELPSLVKEVLLLSDQMEQLAQNMQSERNVIFIGRRQNYATALEASLKLKEVAYLHCEGILAGELKHGPLALVDDNVLLFVIATDDKKMETNIAQLTSRKARMVIMKEYDEHHDKIYKGIQMIHVPKTHACLRPIIDIIPFQLLSYYLALQKGYNVDQPRNLAKSVTVSD